MTIQKINLLLTDDEIKSFSNKNIFYTYEALGWFFLFDNNICIDNSLKRYSMLYPGYYNKGCSRTNIVEVSLSLFTVLMDFDSEVFRYIPYDHDLVYTKPLVLINPEYFTAFVDGSSYYKLGQYFLGNPFELLEISREFIKDILYNNKKVSIQEMMLFYINNLVSRVPVGRLNRESHIIYPRCNNTISWVEDKLKHLVNN